MGVANVDSAALEPARRFASGKNRESFMILYGSPLSPFVRKVGIFAAEKGITLEHNRRIGPQSPDPEFRAVSPFGQIPGFRDGDYTLCDSSAIVAYLEAGHPEPNLIPAEAKARGRTIMFDEFADVRFFGCGRKLFWNRVVAPLFMNMPGDTATADQAEATELPPLLAYMETIIPASLFLVEDRLTLADIAVASPMVNLLHAGVTIDADMYPRLAAYRDAMFARPSFAATIAAETASIQKARTAAAA